MAPTPAAKYLPSGLKVTEFAGPPFVLSFVTTCMVSASMIVTKPAMIPPAAMYFPSGLVARLNTW